MRKVLVLAAVLAVAGCGDGGADPFGGEDGGRGGTGGASSGGGTVGAGQPGGTGGAPAPGLCTVAGAWSATYTCRDANPRATDGPWGASMTWNWSVAEERRCVADETAIPTPAHPPAPNRATVGGFTVLWASWSLNWTGAGMAGTVALVVTQQGQAPWQANCDVVATKQ
jgi:hypothetical protein